MLYHWNLPETYRTLTFLVYQKYEGVVRKAVGCGTKKKQQKKASILTNSCL